MASQNWFEILDRPTERLEFGACQVNYAWRRHKTAQRKFRGLEAAFATSAHRIPLLLQAVDSNYNARNHPERGQALFAAVWFPDSPWAILCSPTHATLVERRAVESIREQTSRNDNTVATVLALFKASPENTREVLDEGFFSRVLCRK